MAFDGDWRFSTTSEYSASEVDADENWDDWDEEEGNECKCLACATIFPSAKETFAHVAEKHGFDFMETRARLNLDFYKCVMLINYARRMASENPDALATLSDLTDKEPFFSDESNLRPFMEEDALLYGKTLAFEDDDFDDDLQSAPSTAVSATSQQTTPKSFEREYRALQQQLENLKSEFLEYKQMVRRTFMDETLEEHPSSSTAPIVRPEDKPYFNSYAGPGIHQEMIQDRVRTESYRNFILHNKALFEGKTVLDVGCGTGILSMFAAQAGAAKVISVDNSDIIDKAQQIVKDNKLDHIIHFVKGQVEHIELPVEKVDIIVSEWMGYFLLYEAMLDSVLVARDRFLAPGGILVPSQTRILLTLLDEDPSISDFWDNVYGFNMSCMKNGKPDEANIENLRAGSIMSNIVTVKDLVLDTITKPELEFRSPFEFVTTRDAEIKCFAGWFDTWFTVDGKPIPGFQIDAAIDQTFFTTGPFGEPTHWKSTAFVLENPINVKTGTVIQGEFICHKGFDSPRDLVCEIHYMINNEPTLYVQTFHLR